MVCSVHANFVIPGLQATAILLALYHYDVGVHSWAGLEL